MDPLDVIEEEAGSSRSRRRGPVTLTMILALTAVALAV